MIIVHCPHCASGFDLIQAWQDKDARRFITLLTALPPKAIQPTFIYVTHCFKPPKQALRWSRLLKLLQELAPMIQDAQIKRNGTFYRVPLESWVTTMQGLVESPSDTLKLPLKDHAYLLTILANQAERAAGKAETKAEADKLAGIRAKPADDEASISFAELAALANEKQQQGDLPIYEPPKAKEREKTKPLTDEVKNSLREALNLRSTKPTLSFEEIEAERQRQMAQAKALMNNQPLQD